MRTKSTVACVPLFCALFLAGGVVLAQGPTILNIGSEEVCGSFSGARPSIDVDSLDQPHIVTDESSSSRLYLYHKVGGNWTETLLAQAGKNGINASRLYMPHIEVDPLDRAWISTKFGCKEYGTMLGQGLWCHQNVTTAPSQKFFKWVSASVTHKGNGNIALDPNEPNAGYMLAANGEWAKISDTGTILASGTWKAGASGEKIRGEISPRPGMAGVWHSAMNGYNSGNVSGGYQNSTRGTASCVAWNAISAYPEQGSDMQHPSVGIDLVNPKVAYIAARFDPGVVINVWDGTKMVYPTGSLKVIDPNGMYYDRWAAQWAPAPGDAGGAFLCWTRGSRVKLIYVGPDGTLGTEQDICSGTRGAICLDSQGDLHLVYLNGGMRYRKIDLAGGQPSMYSPKGTLEGTGKYMFSWAEDTNALSYELWVNMDTAKYTNLTFGAGTTNWTPDNDLALGAYDWWLRTSNAVSTSDWHGPVSFSVAPGEAALVSPTNGAQLYETAGLYFTWSNVPGATAYELWINRNGTTFMTNWTAATNWTPASPAEAGNFTGAAYTWQVRTAHDGVQGLFHAARSFTLRGPPAPTLFSPSVTITQTRPQFSWSQTTAATWYQVWLNRNGNSYTSVWMNGATATNWTPAADLEPGDYSWSVQGWSQFGYGTLSTSVFFDTSGLAPPASTADNPTGILANARPSLTWSQVADATWYQIWINRNGSKYSSFWISGSAATNWTSPTNMPMGDYSWQVQTWNKYGYGTWSPSNTFTVPDFRPPGATLLSPTGDVAVATFRPMLAWEQVSTSSWYQIWLNRNGTRHTSFWLAGSANTNWTPGSDLPAGNWQWWIQTWNDFGLGPWSSAAGFVIPGTAPGSSTGLTPAGAALDARPAFTWTKANRSTWYQLWINSGTIKYSSFWLQGENTTNWTPSADMPSGNYSWWVQTWNTYSPGPWSAKVDFSIPP